MNEPFRVLLLCFFGFTTGYFGCEGNWPAVFHGTTTALLLIYIGFMAPTRIKK